jgi:hypothetical protein
MAFGTKVEAFYLSLTNQIELIMGKKYIYALLFLSFFFFVTTNYAQSTANSSSREFAKDIPGLNIYPNPVANGKIYITSTLNQPKEVIIYDVLGKMVISKTVLGKELNITDLKSGVYILRIQENKQSATRKLVVR